MPRLTGGQALVRSLAREGLSTIFGLPGVQLDWAYDALFEARDTIAVVHTRHEQATAYMADGYARTTGEVGVCLVVPGPGLLNATAALSTAYARHQRSGSHAAARTKSAHARKVAGAAPRRQIGPTHGGH